MSEAEKLEIMRKLIAPDVETEDVLKEVIKEAEALILNKMHPFGYKEGTAIPARYEYLQLQLAVEIYNKRGAEGQVGHTENGIGRAYSSADVSGDVLSKITPVVKTPFSEVRVIT